VVVKTEVVVVMQPSLRVYKLPIILTITYEQEVLHPSICPSIHHVHPICLKLESIQTSNLVETVLDKSNYRGKFEVQRSRLLGTKM